MIAAAEAWLPFLASALAGVNRHVTAPSLQILRILDLDWLRAARNTQS